MRLRDIFAFLIFGMFVVLFLFAALLAYVRAMLAEDQFQSWIRQQLIPAVQGNTIFDPH